MLWPSARVCVGPLPDDWRCKVAAVFCVLMAVGIGGSIELYNQVRQGWGWVRAAAGDFFYPVMLPPATGQGQRVAQRRRRIHTDCTGPVAVDPVRPGQLRARCVWAGCSHGLVVGRSWDRCLPLPSHAQACASSRRAWRAVFPSTVIRRRQTSWCRPGSSTSPS